MADFLWALSAAELPDTLFDWQRITYGLHVPELAAQRAALGANTPRLVMWAFRGEQPLASGLAALFAEFFRWLGPEFDLLLTRFERDPDGLLPWTSEMMQIDPETYTPEHTESRAKLWGELGADGLDLHYAPADSANDSTPISWTLSGTTLEIAAQLIALVPEVLSRLGLQAAQWKPDEALDLTDSESLAVLLRAWGELNIRHELVQVGFEEHTDALEGAIRRTVSAAMTGSRFACWAACRALWPVAADADAPHQADAEDTLVSLASIFPRVAWPGIALSLLEWERNDYERATDLLETAVESDPQALQGWQLLAILYEELNRFDRAIEVCREAIAGNVADAAIYYNLGTLLLDHGDDDDESDEVTPSTVEEALSMLHIAEQRGLHTPELYLRIMDGYEALENEAAVWQAFDQLIKADVDGAVLWQVVEDADTYENFEPGLERLRQAAEAAPDAYEMLAAYTRALIVLDRHSEAEQALPRLREIAKDDYARAETAQLALEATAPDFEEAYGEIADEIEAGMVANADVTGLLKDALAREPAFADGAVLLAQAYQSMGEFDAAVQVISAARDMLPDHLELVLSAADALWANDNDELALWTLQEALSKHPSDVALLARIGEYYFEIGEDNMARDFLEKAEALGPRHPELIRVREQISRALADQEETYEPESYEDQDE